MAKALRAGAKYSEAIAFAKKATTWDADDSEAWFELGECYSSLPNGQNEAKSAYRKSAALKEADLQTNPTDGPGWMALALAVSYTHLSWGSLLSTSIGWCSPL